MTKPAAYVFFDGTITEFRDEGLLQVPPAGQPGDPSEIVRWSAPSGQRTVHWVAAARGGPPEVPAAKSLSNGYVLLRSRVSAKVPHPTLSKANVWALEGFYEYAEIYPRDADGSLWTGTMPALCNTLGGTPADVAAAQFLKGLLTDRPPPHANG